jgi:hypothetical protein
MTRRHAAIVGPDVGDQTQLRPAVPLRSIDEFVSFLAQLEDLFGPIERARIPTTGERFEL